MRHRQFGENVGTATVSLCQHWMDKSTRCGSPAMTGTRHCYSHRLQQARSAKKLAECARQRWFESVRLHDAASVQRALMQVMARLLSGDIGHKQAGQILYALQSASVNLRSGPQEQGSVGLGLATPVSTAVQDQSSKRIPPAPAAREIVRNDFALCPEILAL